MTGGRYGKKGGLMLSTTMEARRECAMRVSLQAVFAVRASWHGCRVARSCGIGVSASAENSAYMRCGMILSRETTASLLILLAGVGWGLLGLFFNLLAGAGLSPLQVSFMRMGGGWIFLALYLGLFRRELFKVRSWKYLLLFFAIGAGSLNFLNIFLFNTMRVSSVAVATVLMYTAPIFVFGMSVLFFKERITRRKAISLLLSVLGCALVSGVIGAEDNRLSLLAFSLGMATSISYASYSILGRFAVEKYSPLTTTFYSFFFCALATAPFAELGILATIPFSWTYALAVLGIAFFGAALPYVFYSIALQYVYPSHAAVLATVEPLVAALISFFILNEQLGVWQILGIGCILSGVALLSLTPSKVPLPSKR